MARQYVIGSADGVRYVIDAEDRSFALQGAYLALGAPSVPVSVSVAGQTIGVGVGTGSVAGGNAPRQFAMGSRRGVDFVIDAGVRDFALRGGFLATSPAVAPPTSVSVTGTPASVMVGEVEVEVGSAVAREYAFGSRAGVSFVLDTAIRDFAIRGGFVSAGGPRPVGIGGVSVEVAAPALHASVGNAKIGPFVSVSTTAVGQALSLAMGSFAVDAFPDWFDVAPLSYKVHADVGPLEIVTIETGPGFGTPSPSGYDNWYALADIHVSVSVIGLELASFVGHIPGLSLGVAASVTGNEITVSVGEARVGAAEINDIVVAVSGQEVTASVGIAQVAIDGVVAPTVRQRGDDAGGWKKGARHARLFIVQKVLEAEDSEVVLPPTPARVRKFIRAAAVDATPLEGLRAVRRPDKVRSTFNAVEAAFHRAQDWSELQRVYDALVGYFQQKNEERRLAEEEDRRRAAARYAAAIEEDDEEIFALID